MVRCVSQAGLTCQAGRWLLVAFLEVFTTLLSFQYRYTQLLIPYLLGLPNYTKKNTLYHLHRRLELFLTTNEDKYLELKNQTTMNYLNLPCHQTSITFGLICKATSMFWSTYMWSLAIFALSWHKQASTLAIFEVVWHFCKNTSDSRTQPKQLESPDISNANNYFSQKHLTPLQ